MWRNVAVLVVLSILLSACGSVSDDDGQDVNAASLGVSSDRNSVPTDGSESATVTATVLDGDNAAIADAPVEFSASAGKLSDATATTGETGEAEVAFEAGVLSSNQVVTVTASTGGLTRQIPLRINGTSMSLSTQTTDIPQDGSETAVAKIALTDAGGNPVQGAQICYQVEASGGGDLSLFSVPAGNALNEDCPLAGESGKLVGTTDHTGKIEVQVAGADAGEANLRIQGAGDSASELFRVRARENVFRIESPAKEPMPLYEANGVGHSITVAGVEASNKVRFATTVGSWENNKSVYEAQTVGGQVTANLDATEAGLANIRVEEVGADEPSSDTMQVAFTAPLDDAARLILQADPRVVPVSGEDVEYTSELIVNLETADGQPVANAPIAFEMLTTAGGGESISPPTVLTGTDGEARATFTSGTKETGTDGLIVRAYVPDASVDLEDTLEEGLVITDQPGSVVIGQASVVETNDTDTAYILPMSVQVADPNGNPVQDAEVTLSNWPSRIHLGFWAEGAEGGVDIFRTASFPNEDANENNRLDPGEDLNGDGELTPKNSVAGSLPRTVTTDANGVANFELTYLKQYAAWVDVRVRASTEVEGDQVTSQITFNLPIEEGEEDDLPNSPFNSGCPFEATADTNIVNLVHDGDGDGDPDDTVTLSLSTQSDALVGVEDRRVTVSGMGGQLRAEGGFTDPSGTFVSVLEAPASSSGTTTVTYQISCADPVEVDVTW